VGAEGTAPVGGTLKGFAAPNGEAGTPGGTGAVIGGADDERGAPNGPAPKAGADATGEAAGAAMSRTLPLASTAKVWWHLLHRIRAGPALTAASGTLNRVRHCSHVTIIVRRTLADPRSPPGADRASAAARLTGSVVSTDAELPFRPLASSATRHARAPRGSGMTTTSQRTAKVIKRYANRKLYDTERSCYVTLDEISQMVKEGEDVRVVDNKTKDDLTAVTLAQIIVEEEKKVQKMPLKLLRSIIQSGNDAFAGFNVGKAAATLREDVERRVEALWKRDRGDKAASATDDGSSDAASADAAADAADAGVDAGAAGTVSSSAAPASPPAEATDGAPAGDDAVKQGVVAEFVHSTTEAFESWQRRVDDRVKDALGKMPGVGKSGGHVDVDALKRRIDELEAKIAALEAARKAG
jgi:polyhydroxyalkanoate synthesis repressor PhaR